MLEIQSQRWMDTLGRIGSRLWGGKVCSIYLNAQLRMDSVRQLLEGLSDTP